MIASQSFRSKSILFLILNLIFVTAVFGQKADQKHYRARYVGSVSKIPSKTVKPGIRIVKRTGSGVSGAPVLKKLKAAPLMIERKTFELINLERVKRGLPKLKWNPQIARLARGHSENMAVHSFFSHRGLNGRTIDQRASDFGIRGWRSIGENIAYNKGFTNPGEFAVERWMLSSGHKLNLLNTKWTESGVGIAVTEDGKYFFTQIFMTR